MTPKTPFGQGSIGFFRVFSCFFQKNVIFDPPQKHDFGNLKDSLNPCCLKLGVRGTPTPITKTTPISEPPKPPLFWGPKNQHPGDTQKTLSSRGTKKSHTRGRPPRPCRRGGPKKNTPSPPSLGGTRQKPQKMPKKGGL